jgi:hypothetical protein
MAFYSMITGDAALFAGSVKVFHLLNRSTVFTPITVDIAYGHSFSAFYCQFIVVFMTALSVLAALLAFAIAFTNNQAHYTSLWGSTIVTMLTRPIEFAQRSDQGKLFVLIFLRWSIEFLLLSAFHITVPDQYGETFRNTVGLGAGISICFVSGRDMFLMGRYKANKTRSMTIGAVLLVMVVVHSSVFMVYPTFGVSPRMTVPVAITSSWAISLQSTCAGCLWAAVALSSVQV